MDGPAAVRNPLCAISVDNDRRNSTMKNLAILLVFLRIMTSDIFGQTPLEAILSDYKKNPSRAIEKYLDKTTVMFRAKIDGIYPMNYSTSVNKIVVHCNSERLKSIELEDISTDSLLKLNNHDSILVKGVFSSRPKTSKNIWFSQILIKKTQITQLSRDLSWQDELRAEHNCQECAPGIKKYNEYVVEDILNSARSEKSHLNKPLTIKFEISSFYKENIKNFIKKYGIAGQVSDGTQSYKIVVYDIPRKDQLNMNIGDTIIVTGNLVQSDGNRFAVSENNKYDLITLRNCTWKK